MESYGWRKSVPPMVSLPYLSSTLYALGIVTPMQVPRQQDRFGDWVDIRWQHVAPYYDPDTGQPKGVINLSPLV
jgi:hypothetical protein